MINLFVYVDALPKESICDRFTPFIKELQDENNSYELQNILGYSFGIQSTILTGRMPSETMHWMPYYYDPKKGVPITKLLGSMSRKLDLNIEMPKLLKTIKYGFMSRFLMRGKAGVNAIPFTEIDKFFIYPYYYMNELPFYEKLKEELFEVSRTSLLYFGPPIYKTGVINKLENYLLNIINGKIDFPGDLFIILYIDKLDHRGHGSGYRSDIWLHTLFNIDKQLKNIYKILRNMNDDFNFVIFSDHGLCNIKETVNIPKFLRKMGIGWKNISYLIDATICNVWFNDNYTRNKFIKMLDIIGDDKVVYFDRYEDVKTLTKYGVNFEDNRYGDLILQTKPSYMFFPNHYSDRKPFKGTHGYLPEEDVQNAYVIVDINSEKRLSFKPKHIRDIYRVIWSLS